ncbi:hypothetical protein MNV84_03739 [Leishmania braziliensis]|nr:hypothetical protein MNV84_03739 [Leishmania braziliensis]
MVLRWTPQPLNMERQSPKETKGRCRDVTDGARELPAALWLINTAAPTHVLRASLSPGYACANGFFLEGSKWDSHPAPHSTLAVRWPVDWGLNNEMGGILFPATVLVALLLCSILPFCLLLPPLPLLPLLPPPYIHTRAHACVRTTTTTATLPPSTQPIHFMTALRGFPSFLPLSSILLLFRLVYRLPLTLIRHQRTSSLRSTAFCTTVYLFSPSPSLFWSRLFFALAPVVTCFLLSHSPFLFFLFPFFYVAFFLGASVRVYCVASLLLPSPTHLLCPRSLAPSFTISPTATPLLPAFSTQTSAVLSCYAFSPASLRDCVSVFVCKSTHHFFLCSPPVSLALISTLFVSLHYRTVTVLVCSQSFGSSSLRFSLFFFFFVFRAALCVLRVGLSSPPQLFPALLTHLYIRSSPFFFLLLFAFIRPFSPSPLPSSLLVSLWSFGCLMVCCCRFLRSCWFNVLRASVPPFSVDSLSHGREKNFPSPQKVNQSK